MSEMVCFRSRAAAADGRQLDRSGMVGRRAGWWGEVRGGWGGGGAAGVVGAVGCAWAETTLAVAVGSLLNAVPDEARDKENLVG